MHNTVWNLLTHMGGDAMESDILLAIRSEGRYNANSLKLVLGMLYTYGAVGFIKVGGSRRWFINADNNTGLPQTLILARHPDDLEACQYGWKSQRDPACRNWLGGGMLECQAYVPLLTSAVNRSAVLTRWFMFGENNVQRETVDSLATEADRALHPSNDIERAIGAIKDTVARVPIYSAQSWDGKWVDDSGWQVPPELEARAVDRALNADIYAIPIDMLVRAARVSQRPTDTIIYLAGVRRAADAHLDVLRQVATKHMDRAVGYACYRADNDGYDSPEVEDLEAMLARDETVIAQEGYHSAHPSRRRRTRPQARSHVIGNIANDNMKWLPRGLAFASRWFDKARSKALRLAARPFRSSRRVVQATTFVAAGMEEALKNIWVHIALLGPLGCVTSLVTSAAIAVAEGADDAWDTWFIRIGMHGSLALLPLPLSTTLHAVYNYAQLPHLTEAGWDMLADAGRAGLPPALALHQCKPTAILTLPTWVKEDQLRTGSESTVINAIHRAVPAKLAYAQGKGRLNLASTIVQAIFPRGVASAHSIGPGDQGEHIRGAKWDAVWKVIERVRAYSAARRAAMNDLQEDLATMEAAASHVGFDKAAARVMAIKFGVTAPDVDKEGVNASELSKAEVALQQSVAHLLKAKNLARPAGKLVDVLYNIVESNQQVRKYDVAAMCAAFGLNMKIGKKEGGPAHVEIQGVTLKAKALRNAKNETVLVGGKPLVCYHLTRGMATNLLSTPGVSKLEVQRLGAPVVIVDQCMKPINPNGPFELSPRSQANQLDDGFPKDWHLPCKHGVGLVSYGPVFSGAMPYNCRKCVHNAWLAYVGRIAKISPIDVHPDMIEAFWAAMPTDLLPKKQLIVDSVAKWLSHFPEEKWRMLLQKARPDKLFEESWRIFTSQAFVKREINLVSPINQATGVKRDIEGNPLSDPRLIQPCDPMLQIALSPVAVAMSKLVSKEFHPAKHPSLIYAAGLNSDELGAWVETALEHYSSKSQCVAFEFDMARFDCTVSEPAFKVWFRILEHVGVHEDIVRLYEKAQRWYTIMVERDVFAHGTSAGKRGYAWVSKQFYGVRSGMPTTSVGNSMLMAIMLHAAATAAHLELAARGIHVSVEDILWGAVMGDDMIVFCSVTYAPIVGRHLQRAFMHGGVNPEGIYHENPHTACFLSKAFVPVRFETATTDRDGIALLPKLGRMITRMGWSLTTRSDGEEALHAYGIAVGLQRDLGNFPIIRTLCKHLRARVDNGQQLADLLEKHYEVAALEAQRGISRLAKRTAPGPGTGVQDRTAAMTDLQRQVGLIHDQASTVYDAALKTRAEELAKGDLDQLWDEPKVTSQSPIREAMEKVLERDHKIRIAPGTTIRPNSQTYVWMHTVYGVTQEEFEELDFALDTALSRAGTHCLYDHPIITHIVNVDVRATVGHKLPEIDIKKDPECYGTEADMRVRCRNWAYLPVLQGWK